MLNPPAPDSKETSVATPIARLFFIDAAAQIAFIPEQVSLIISLVSGALARYTHPYVMPIIAILGIVRLLWFLFLIRLALAFGPLPWSIPVIVCMQRMIVYAGVLTLICISSTPLVARLVASGVVAAYPLGYIVIGLMWFFSYCAGAR